ncbi:MAG TPA: NfeD family protein [Methyloceanibacter sp.]|nr:NfeD family protein [Methyloceanibacter sp.]
MQTILALGPWNWMILAAILLTLELFSPGLFIMWFGVAAAITGVVAFSYDVSWQWQLIWFCGLSLASVLLAAKYLRRNPLASERPLLNRRALQLIGQSFDLVDPIVNGRGSIKSGDTIWRVEGPELPRGTRITVVGADGTLLKVTEASAGA